MNWAQKLNKYNNTTFIVHLIFYKQLWAYTHLMEQKSQKYLGIIFWVSAQAAVKSLVEI